MLRNEYSKPVVVPCRGRGVSARLFTTCTLLKIDFSMTVVRHVRR